MRWQVDGARAGDREVAAAVTATALRLGVHPARSGALELAIHEVLINAVEHGHRGDRDLPVEVAVASDDGQVLVTVTDGAVGGPWSEDIPDRAAPTADRGRGLVLTRAAVDHLDLHRAPGRTEVRLWLARR